MLLASHRLSYLPSASILPLLRRPPGDGAVGGTLAVGNPFQMGRRPVGGGAEVPLRSLPASAPEAEMAAASLSGSRLLLGSDATREAVLEDIGRFRRLHFATHGHLSREVPLLSSLALARGESLSAYELMGLRLRADLAVLSACRSGLGERTRGDEVQGLPRALLAAGCRRVVVSLWAVDDVSTSLLMRFFYEGLGTGEEPVEALRLAQLRLRGLDGRRGRELREEVRQGIGIRERGRVREMTVEWSGGDGPTRWRADPSHPSHWAPFVLIGV